MNRRGSSWRRQPKEQPAEEDSALSILTDFCEDTSWGGLGRVAGSKYLLFRLIWLLAFLGAFGAGIYQLYGLFNTYQSKPINTRISLEHSSRLAFPTVTVCNFNMIRKSRLKDLPVNIKGDVEKFSKKRNKTTPGKKNKNKHNEENDVPDPDKVDDDYKSYEKLVASLSREDSQVLETLGHQYNNMILSCKFKGVDCSHTFGNDSDWDSYWHYKYGNCYSFNKKIQTKGRSAQRSSSPGPAHGLILEIDTQQNEYIAQMTEDAGVIVNVSPRGQMPFPSEEGMSIAPGFSTSIGLRMVNIQRVDRFGNNSCVNVASQNNNNLYQREFKTEYSTMACTQSCMAYNQKSFCGCMEYQYYPKDKVICDVFNITTVICLRKVLIMARNNKLNCSTGCPPPCTEQIFRMTSSFSTWPSDNYMDSLAVKLNTNESTEHLRKNLLKLHIFYQDLNYENIAEEISYQIENFVSDIGGQLGLWLGVSVLSGLEVIELISLIFIHFCCGKPKRKNNNLDLQRNGQQNMQMT